MALFPGQGAQHPGMGKDLVENFSAAKLVFEEASEAIKLDLKRLCFEGSEADLALTENTQPALLTASVAAFRAAQKELDLQPSAAAGHSLGEYSALVAIGALPLATAVAWVRERGAAMQRAVPAGQGTMAAVMGLEDTQIQNLCEKATQAARAARDAASDHPWTVEAIVEPANFNSPGQVVIAGSGDAVREALQLAKSEAVFAGAKVIPLQVSAPFHCRLMRPARDRMANLFASSAVKPQSLPCPYLPNRTARLNQEPGTIFELLVEQVDHPVLWKQSMLAAQQSGHTSFVEFGPGKVLTGLAKRIDRSFRLANVPDSAGLKALEPFLNERTSS